MAVLSLVCVRGRGGALSLWAKTKDFNSYTCRVPKNAGCLRKCLHAAPETLAPAEKQGSQLAHQYANKVSQSSRRITT
jgi:hypothetical protein